MSSFNSTKDCPYLNELPYIDILFGNRQNPHTSHPLWQKKTLPQWKQVHGTQNREVIHPGQDCGEIDALWTQKPQIPLAVVTADCVPILLAHQNQKIIAAIHAGWRGTLANISAKTVKDILSRTQTQSEDWIASIGPSIALCCYEVSQELAQEFEKKFGHEHGEKLTQSSQLGSSSWTPITRGRHLNLKEVNRRQLLELGLQRISISKECTCCKKKEEEFLYWSYRRDRSTQRNASVIMIKN